MKVDKTIIDSLNAEVKLTIQQEDYLSEFNNQLKSFQSKASMKGFRKGKTPISIIKKMYGAGTMQDTISKILTTKINELISSDEYNIIGEPLLIDEQNLPVIDFNDPQDYTYEFQIGLEPEFDVIGVSENDQYLKRSITITEELIDEEMKGILQKAGTQESTSEAIIEGDIIYLKALELDGKKIKDGGHVTEFSVQLDSLTSHYKDQLKGKKIGGVLDFDIYQLEEGTNQDQVIKYFLKLKEDQNVDEIGAEFRAEITDVVRVDPAKLNQELFDKTFGKDEVKSEDEAREKIKGYLKDYFEHESINLFNREIMQGLMEKNPMELPEAFLKKWLSQEKEIDDKQFEGFKKELKWRIIKRKLVKSFEVEVKEEEIFKYFVDTIRNYSPYIDEVSLKNTAFSLMKNRDQLNTAVETISSGKLFDAIRGVVKAEEKEIDKEGFYNIVKSLNQKAE